MLDNRRLILDTHCEVYDLLTPYMDEYFWDLSRVVPREDAIYLIGREQARLYPQVLRELVDQAMVFLSNPHEGSETLAQHCAHYGFADLATSKRLKLIGGGNMGPEYACLQYDSFLPKILNYPENVQAIEQYNPLRESRPYKFLFLNGRYRPHRKQLIEQLDLSQALWTNLDQLTGTVQYLPPKYEIEKYRENQTTCSGFVKYNLFANEWGEIYLNTPAYQDTYFSLVTETVFEYPYSFRTEKIWKPIAIGHPFIVAANYGYYRDLRNIGFCTFSHVIDESFDLIEDNQKRLDRVVQVIKDICSQDLDQFLRECYTICKYNQQHLADMRRKVRKEFPERFRQFINE